MDNVQMVKDLYDALGRGVRDGKVISWRHYVDTGQLRDVMGARYRQTAMGS